MAGIPQTLINPLEEERRRKAESKSNANFRLPN